MAGAGAARVPDIVGRGEEQQVLRRLVERLPDGGGVLVVRGDPGVGKSTLLAEAARLAPGFGARVLRTTGVEPAGQVAFAGLEQLLRPLRNSIGHLARPQRAALASALGQADDAVPDVFLVALATLNLVAEAAPVLVVVEDGQWLDQPSAEVLAFVARRLDFEPIGIVAAIRAGHSSPLADAAMPVLDLAPLSGPASAALLDARFPTLPAVARRRVLDEAAGNPLALLEFPLSLAGTPESRRLLNLLGEPDNRLPPDLTEEAVGVAGSQPSLSPHDPVASQLPPHSAGMLGASLRQLTEHARGAAEAIEAEPLSDVGAVEGRLPLPERLERAFGARTQGLPEATLALLLAAAVDDGDELSEVLAAATIIRGGEPVTVDDVAPAVAGGLIAVAGGRLEFRHPLVRSAILQQAPPGRRHRAHAALAEVLRADIERRAWHRGASVIGPDDDVAADLGAAGVRALRRGAVETAVAAFERAAQLSVDLARRADRLLRAADLAAETGRRDAVRRLLGQAEALDLSSAQRTLATWIRDSFDDGLHDVAANTRGLADLAERVAAGGDADLALRILWTAAIRCYFAEPGEDVRRWVVAVAERSCPDSGDPRLLAILAFVAPIERGRAVLDRLPEVTARSAGDPTAARLLSNAAMATGAFDTGLALATAAVTGLRAQGRLALLARAASVRSWCAWQLTDLAEAIPSAREAVRLARETGQPHIRLLALAHECVIAATVGEDDEAERLASEVERAALPAGLRPALAGVQAARGLSALGTGRYSDAFEHLRRVFDPADPAYHLGSRCFLIGDLVEAAVRSGRAEPVRPLLAEMEVAGRSTPSPSLHLNLRYARALLATDDNAEGLFQAALRADLARWPFARARVQLAYGQWLRRQRRPAEARGHLRAAREAFDALGTVAWGDRARWDLRASGEASRGRPAPARELLTPQELQIAQMAADGLTNREIGQRLYLSHRTVSTHLQRIYPKLGVTSRGALAGALQQ
ncbi:AAA family ATPase [Actinoplanes sp. NPDC049596]|uniref:ATP-binding protein n=1 Tax=unclassified Actinoplanes TaxID=2626549 RepID=UPI00342D29B5